MKWMMAVGAVLAVPALAFGAASYTLTAGGSGTDGTATITVCKLTDPCFSVDLGIDQDDAIGCALFGGALAASANDTFYVTGRTMNVDDAYLATVNNKWTNNNNKWLETTPHSGQNFGAIKNVYYWPASDFPKVVETIDLCVDPDAPNGNYTISIGDPGGGIYIGDYTGENEQTPLDSSATVTVHVIPEPASLLLLAGVLPFLRRRR
jgi:hypothetical protein